jgi:rhamnosyltransferase subunit B
MNFLLMNFGTAGDINPFIGLGIALKGRGHTVTFSTNPYFESAVTRAGLPLIPIGTREEYLTILGHPDLWSEQRGIEILVRDGIRVLIRPVFEVVRQFAQSPNTVIITSWAVFGARFAQEKFGIPLITVDLMPGVIASLDATPVHAGLDFSGWPRWAKWGMFRFGDLMIRRLLDPDFNQLRREVGLPPVRGTLNAWCQSPLRAVGLWPEWFGPIQRDWPASIRLTNFPLYDDTGVEPLSGELETFLKDGPPPVVFTPGSGMRQGNAFFQESVNACRQTGRRGLLLTRFTEQVPSNLPSSIRVFNYVPFSRLLPACAAIVHQAGIGNVSQAFAAGIPQIVMPMTFDQPDNAARIERLGAGLTLQPKDYRSDKIAALLDKLDTDPSYRLRAQELQRQLRGQNGLSQTCEVIEQTC